MTRALRERLADAPAALPFAEAVLAQLTGPAGALREAPASERERVAALLCELILAAGEARRESPVAGLVDEHALVAALFQNAELLYQHGYARADAVSRAVMRVIEEWHSGAFE